MTGDVMNRQRCRPSQINENAFKMTQHRGRRESTTPAADTYGIGDIWSHCGRELQHPTQRTVALCLLPVEQIGLIQGRLVITHETLIARVTTP